MPTQNILKSLEKYFKIVEEHKAIIILSFIILIFNSIIENEINSFIVNPIMSKVNNSSRNDFIFTVILIFIFFNFILKLKRNFKISKRDLINMVILLITFLYYRFISSIWTFTGFHLINSFKYLDIIAVFLIFNILLFFLHKPQKESLNKKTGFYIDTPLNDDKKDLLNREKIAKLICTKINETKSTTPSFAIGISSEWGAGKTSFLHLIEKNIKNDSNIIIKYNPWINDDSKNIVKSFFDELSSELSKYHSNISPIIKNYRNILLDISDNSLNKIIKPLISSKSIQQTALSEFNLLNKKIKSLNKQIIIFIDDLDRLVKRNIC